MNKYNYKKMSDFLDTLLGYKRDKNMPLDSYLKYIIDDIKSNKNEITKQRIIIEYLENKLESKINIDKISDSKSFINLKNHFKINS